MARSGSTRTSLNTAPNEWPEHCCCSWPGRELTVASMGCPASIAHRSRARRALAPAELLRAGRVALAQRLARPRMSALRIALGVILQAQRNGIHVERVCQLVHCALERERAARFARRAHERGR